MTDNTDIVNHAKQNKRFLERIEISPYRYRKGDVIYRRAHLFRITSKLYNNFVFTPYDLSYEEVKHVFFKFVLIHWYLKDLLKKANEHATKDYTASIYGYRSQLKSEVLRNHEFDDVYEEVKEFINLVDMAEEYLDKVAQNYKQYSAKRQEINRKEEFTDEDVRELQVYFGKSRTFQFLQGKCQKEMGPPSRKLLEFMRLNKMNLQKKYEDLYMKTKLISSTEGEAKLDHSLKNFGQYEENLLLSNEQLIEKFIKSNEEDYYKAFNDDFIQRKVRNPSVRNHAVLDQS
ncbi:hypothetical protein [Rossellomorea marisflavi]|uniref:hypothetical protein n=1 Tax=Rossellomorea marisflavi TaxID=189381 RepID=UPI003511D259